MSRNTLLLLVGLALLQVTACRKDDSPTSGSRDDVINRFETALIKGDHAGAYATMCPEYRDQNDANHFSRSLSASPYLRRIASFGGGTIVTQGGVTERRGVTISSFGHIPSVIYARDLDQTRCIISLTVAGVPVVGPGILREN